MKRQVLGGSKLCATVLSMLLAFHPVFSQAQAPELNVAIFRDLVRFAAPGGVQEMRVEVFNSTGEKIYDSNFVAGQTKDWPLQDQQGPSVESGLYAYTVTIKDQGGAIRQMQRGNVIIDRAREGLEAAPPIDHSQARPPEIIQPQPAESWDVDHGKNPYIINAPAIGIGTRNPFARLHIGAGTAEPITKGSTLLLEEGEATGMVLKSTAGGEMFLSQDNRQGVLGTASNHPFDIRTNNQNRLSITSQGNVGIGTASPTSPLTVAGLIETTSGGFKFPDGTIQTTAASGSSTNGNNATGSNVADGKSRSNKGVEPAGSDTDAWRMNGNDNVTTGNFLGTKFGQPLIFKTNNTERMQITSDGNVGIGALTPTSRLHVNESAVNASFDKAGSHFFLESNNNTGQTINKTHSVISVEGSTWLGFGWAGQIGVKAVVGPNWGPITDARAFYAQGKTRLNFHNITNYSGYYADSPTVVTNSSIVNAYGLYVGLQKTANVGNGYGVYQAGAADINYFSGNVGIGVTNPLRTLEIAGNSGNVLWAGASTGSTANIDLSGHVQLREFGPHGFAFLQARDDSSSRQIGLRIRTQRLVNGLPTITEAATIDPTGKVGIGTASPTSPLTVAGLIETTSGGIKFPDGTTQTTRGLSSIATTCCTLEGNGTSVSPLRVASPLGLVSEVSNSTISGTNTSIHPTGVGVYGQAQRGSGVKGISLTGRGVLGENISATRIGDQPGVYGRGNAEDGGQFISTAGSGIFAQGANYGAYVVGTNVGVYGESNSATGYGGIFANTAVDGIALRVEGQIQITGGADLSEHFEIKVLDSNSAASPRQAQPGLVVSIDPDKPGKLALSSQAYDRRVAGIISGAGGVKPGLLMSQTGSIADGSHPVALTGRVYCWADASTQPINPGDLLTTSHIPGHAMKVSDHAKAQGAIIGKAMTGLKQGRGLVLVLVTLQ